MPVSLLDFDLFAGDKAHWHFRLLDPEQPMVRLELLQLHILELRKLDHQQSTGTLTDWVTYLKHWREDTVMSEIRHPPVQKALDQLKSLSNDEETRWRALARERALHDEASFLAAERRKGLEEGLEEGQHKGQAAVLTRLLTLKFGGLPDTVRQRLDQASLSELDTWAERVLSADTLDEIFLL